MAQVQLGGRHLQRNSHESFGSQDQPVIRGLIECVALEHKSPPPAVAGQGSEHPNTTTKSGHNNVGKTLESVVSLRTECIKRL